MYSIIIIITLYYQIIKYNNLWNELTNILYIEYICIDIYIKIVNTFYKKLYVNIILNNNDGYIENII